MGVGCTDCVGISNLLHVAAQRVKSSSAWRMFNYYCLFAFSSSLNKFWLCCYGQNQQHRDVCSECNVYETLCPAHTRLNEPARWASWRVFRGAFQEVTWSYKLRRTRPFRCVKCWVSLMVAWHHLEKKTWLLLYCWIYQDNKWTWRNIRVNWWI